MHPLLPKDLQAVPKMKLPNYLTLFRIALVPLFVVAFYWPFEDHYFWSAVIFAVAGFTDFFDGYVARKMGATSALGAFLDPVADKLMVVIALTLLVWMQNTSWLTIPAFLIIGREVTVSALREWMAQMGGHADVKVHWLGKVKTVAQMVAITGLIANPADFANPWTLTAYVLLYFSVVLTLWSMVLYFKAAWPYLTGAQNFG
jgi:CDP-diacylglycerol--glycerol-3-phosphate 3-phosphatidyltransferase